MGNETLGMGTDVAFTVKRKGEVVDERRVIADTEVDPVVARWAENLMKLEKQKEEE